MKKSLLALGASIVALSGFAGVPVENAATSPFSFDGFQNEAASRGINLGNVERPVSNAKKAPAKVGKNDIIYNPQGRRQNMTEYYTDGLYMWMGISFQHYNPAQQATDVVYGDNDEIYIRNLVPKVNTKPEMAVYGLDSYVKGRIEGDKILVDLPQTVYWIDAEGWDDGYDLMFFNLEDVFYQGEWTQWFTANEDKLTLTLNLYEDGSIEMPELPDDMVLGLGFTTDHWFANYGFWGFKMTPFYEEVVTPPGAEEGYFPMTSDYWTYSNTVYTYSLTGWMFGSDGMYLRGLTDRMPEAWVKLDADPDQPMHYKIKQNQYIGVYEDYYMWTKCCKLEFDENYNITDAVLMPDDYEYEVVWKPATADSPECIEAVDKDVYLIINADKERPWIMDAFFDFKLLHKDSFAGTPVDPSKISVFEFGGRYIVVVRDACVSTENQPLMEDDLYYEVYLDDEPLEFEPDLYEGLEETITLVPWNLNIYSIYRPEPYVHTFDVFYEGWETIGVQVVYKYNGVETRSNKVVYNIITDETTVVPNESTAVETVTEGKKVADVKFFDLSGRQVANPANGIFVKKVTFEDGSVKTTKAMVK